MKFLKFHDFQVFHDLYEPCLSKVFWVEKVNGMATQG